MQRGHCQTFAGASHNLLLNRLLSCLWFFLPSSKLFFIASLVFLILEFGWQVRPALPALERLVHSNDEEVLTDACWALSYLSDGTNDKIQAVIEAGVCTRLVQLLLWVLHSVDVFLLLLRLFYGCMVQIMYVMHQTSFPFGAHSCPSYSWKYCDWRWYSDSGICFSIY